MKITLRHLGIRPAETITRWIEAQILALSGKRRIEAANVRLVCRHAASPAYDVQVHLVTPGPDVFAGGRDHTLRAAFAKVMRQLNSEIDARAQKRLRKTKSKLSLPITKSRSAGPFSSGR